MQIVFDPRQRAHAPGSEFHRGKTIPYFESPARVDSILQEIQRCELGQITPPTEHSIDILTRVHDPDYVSFLRTAWQQWSAVETGEAKPHVWPSPSMRPPVPSSIYGKLGFYSFDATCGITETTWQSAWASAQSAASAAELTWENQRHTFALCRPPGHHAERKAFGGYCYLNSAAVAAQRLLNLGASRVAVLDVDYHHGNGTQEIFYDRRDVLVASLHADPRVAYPYFSGYAGETGVGDGESANINVPLSERCDMAEYGENLSNTLQRVHDDSPDAIVVSFGADTFQSDPLGTFRLTTEDLGRIGQMIVALNTPAVIVLEGGYAIEALGANVAAFLRAFASPK